MKGRAIESDRSFYHDAARHAAVLGLIGIVVMLAMMVWQLPSAAASKHLSIASFLAGTPQSVLELACLVLAALGFVLAVTAVCPRRRNYFFLQR